eukprot:6323140-Amphidinium_carterae.1
MRGRRQKRRMFKWATESFLLQYGSRVLLRSLGRCVQGRQAQGVRNPNAPVRTRKRKVDSSSMNRKPVGPSQMEEPQYSKRVLFVKRAQQIKPLVTSLVWVFFCSFVAAG